jgi:polyphenol oxidase
MFQKRLHRNDHVGFEATVGNAIFFFGTRYCSRTLLRELFPQLEFSFLKQVHGPRIVEAAPSQTLEADGQVTGAKNVALVIQTADCLPILMMGKNKIAALHAGWRGLAVKIIEAATAHGPFDCAAIGPHIRAKHYEVGNDVAAQLHAVGPSDSVLPHSLSEKKWLDLTKIAQFQMRHTHPSACLEVLPDDTFASPLFHSFRRGKAANERQYSFVALTGDGIN